MPNSSSAHPPSDDSAWRDHLRTALESANIPTLLMVLVHLTGQTRWLESRYQCTKVRGIDDHDTGGLSDAVQHEVRDAAFEAVAAWKSGASAAPMGANEELLRAMLGISIGEPFSASYAKMVASGLGYGEDPNTDGGPRWEVPSGFQVVVIGAGVAGICAAIQLKRAGVPFAVLEKNAQVGGTWYENRYPGAGVDTPNHIYSFSFAKHDWSRYFALRDEIQAYFESVASDYGIRESISFQTTVESARYDDSEAVWIVEAVDGKGDRRTLRADVLLSAVGLLNVPKIPAIRGMEDFAGPCFHTARWPSDLEVEGKRVAIVGNGASAMQVVPAIATKVKHLTVFQRSKQWAAPFEKFQKEVPDGVRFLLREVPFYQEWYRQRLSWIFNDRIHFSLQKDPEWPHPDRSINKANDKHRIHFTNYIIEELGSRQDLLPQVLPDYPPFGKRMLMDNGWYRTMARENVTLVTGEIDRVSAGSVVTKNGIEHPADILVIATGFDALNMLGSFKLFGRLGKSIRQAWSDDGPQAFFGVAIPEFPNFFALAGPNTALGHGGSVVALLETQVRYVMGLIRKAIAECGGLFEMEVRREAHDEYNRRVQEAHERMIWTHRGMSNWYRNAQGRVVATTPFRNDDYWEWLQPADLQHYRIRHVPSDRAIARAAVLSGAPAEGTSA